ncbi:MAG: branched-chain amino acid ABC transporter permease [Deltaproteobacteria bacterium]|nr:branched-chain amino acid ABC transporter permease [Deltaproteobacteria bacterium]MBW2138036.1 branched-chain amino acid ABC transporter permease [Deltaproteobacteria bacterium]
MAFASGYFKTSYSADISLIETKGQWVCLVILMLFLIFFPFLASAFLLDIAHQILLALIGSVALMLLTGYAGQISLGHAGLIAAGAFTTAILFKEVNAPIYVTLPASGLMGAFLGFVFGLPSLRLKGLYLALSTLALHFIVIYLGAEYESSRGFATGIIVDSPSIGPLLVEDPRIWYFLFLAADIIVILFAKNLVRSRTGRSWMAIRDRDVAAEALGIKVASSKLSAFMVYSVMSSISGCLFAYFRGFVSVEAFSLLMTIEYIAMIIIGGLGTILGAVFGTVFVVVLPYLIDTLVDILQVPTRFTTYMFAIKYASFGLIMIVFLVLEPTGLVGIWRKIRDYFVLWPFRYRPIGR